MVRVKHRYLLVQILYPSPPSSTTAPSTTLTLHAPTPDHITASLLTRILREKIDLLFGDYGAGAVGPSLAIKYHSNATSTFIVRCARAVVRLVWCAITFVSALPAGSGEGGGYSLGGREKVGQRGREGEMEVVMRVVRVSGTMRKCEEEAIRRAKALMGRVRGIEAMREAGVVMDVRGSAAGEEEDVARDEEEDTVMIVDEEDDDDDDD